VGAICSLETFSVILYFLLSHARRAVFRRVLFVCRARFVIPFSIQACLFLSGEIALASHKSALKAHRQSLKRRARNRIVKGHVRGAIKRTRTAIAAGDLTAAQEYLREAVSHLDRAAKKGVIHPNNAARRKSRLMKLLNRATSGQ
jgi:small subunit ribosomal protein S20